MKKPLLILLCISLAFLCACWDARELSDIGLVVMTGFDLDDNGLNRITVLSVQPFGRSTEQGEIATTWIGTASGHSSFEAMRNLRRVSTRTLVWTHNKIIMVGEDKAKQNLGHISDVIARNREFRYDSMIFVTTGRADEFMQIPAELEKNLFRELLGMIDNTKEWSKGFALSIKDFESNTFSTYKTGYVIGNMGFYETSKLTFSHNHQENLKLFWKDTLHPVAYVSGGAVVDKNQLVGWLSPDELRGYLFLSNQLEEGTLHHKAQGDNAYEATVDILESETKITFPSVSTDRITAKVTVEAKGSLAEIDGFVGKHDVAFIEKLEKELARNIISEMSATMNTAQNRLCTDFVGFHKAFAIQCPREWKETECNWRHSFSEMIVTYDVNYNITQEGLLSRSIIEKGE